MTRNLDGRLEKLERARGIRRGVHSVREMTNEELIWLLQEAGCPITDDMPDSELIPILEAIMDEEKRKEDGSPEA